MTMQYLASIARAQLHSFPVFLCDLAAGIGLGLDNPNSMLSPTFPSDVQPDCEDMVLLDDLLQGVSGGMLHESHLAQSVDIHLTA